MKVSDYIAATLERRGVDVVFEMVGGMITHLLDSLHKKSKIQIVSVHHEQSAAFAVDAYGRMNGKPAVAMATSGPGATNLLTGIGSCYFDSSPAIFITGQVNRNEQKGNRNIRQLGFQETDIVSMAKPITKASWLVTHENQVPEILDLAFDVAMSGRPGPVLIDIPMDVQRCNIDPNERLESNSKLTACCANAALVNDIFDALAASRQPLVLIGGGISASRQALELRKFVELMGLPTVNSLMAVDVLPHQHPLRVGLIGSYGNRWANLALGTADFLLVLGSRLDVRQTGSDTKSFKGTKAIFHVDCEAGEVNNRVKDCVPILSELPDFFRVAFAQLACRTFPTWQIWKSEIAALRARWPDESELAKVSGINPNVLMQRISKFSENASAYVIDVGQHQMWAAQSLQIRPGQRFLTSGGMGSMGFALPASIGAALAERGKAVVVVAGDGGFQCNIQELQTVVRNKLPLKIVVVNNQCHGMVRQFQETYFDKRYQSTLWGYSAPDFAKVAAAYGIRSETIRSPDDIDHALMALWKDPKEPRMLQVMVDSSTNVYPKLAFGRPITEMEPFSKPTEMEAT
jgi:acetolactate synthase I/II/III large subunit